VSKEIDAVAVGVYRPGSTGSIRTPVSLLLALARAIVTKAVRDILRDWPFGLVIFIWNHENRLSQTSWEQNFRKVLPEL